MNTEYVDNHDGEDFVIPHAGGYQTVAIVLEKVFKVPISRQLVWMWWFRRKRNGFPEGFMQVARKGRPIRWFYLAEVIDWCRRTNHPNIGAEAIEERNLENGTGQ